MTHVYKTINNTQDSLQLQKDRDAVTKWENEWSMEFHPDKCKLLRITNKLKPIEASYYMHNHKLDKVETGKYLDFTEYHGNHMQMRYAKRLTKLELSFNVTWEIATGL